MNDEDDASEAERAQAEALARALDGDPGADAPDDALQAALLLRHTGARGELAPDRAEEILQDLLGDAPSAAERDAPPWVEPSKRSRVLRLSAIGVTLAAAAALLFFSTEPDEPRAAPASDVSARAELPAASTSLLAAQADLLRQSATPGAQDPAVAERFDRELRAYRVQLLHALQAVYPAPVGMLAPPRRSR
jgi:hypothetical protein